jgi:7-carboxy-7-deazaguanine synthase
MSVPSIRISEVYQSRQGEGRLTGVESVFLRTSGCNLRCHFCDTPFTSWHPEGDSWSLDKIIATVESFSADHVVITGGEPMLPPAVVELTHDLRARGKHLTIETAGTIDREVACNLMSISPKLANSTPSPERSPTWALRHEQTRWQPTVINELITRYDYQLKFVVDQPEDLAEIDQMLEQLIGYAPEKVWLMPQGVELEVLREKHKWLSPLCTARGFNLCERKHIEWYGNRRGT